MKYIVIYGHEDKSELERYLEFKTKEKLIEFVNSENFKNNRVIATYEVLRDSIVEEHAKYTFKEE